MKNLQWGFILIGILLSSNTSAQFNNFNLSDYKLPEIKRQALSLNFDFLGANSNTKNDKSLDIDYLDRSSSYTRSNFLIHYNLYLNSEFKQQTKNAYFSFNTSFTKQESPESIKKSFDISPYLQYDASNRIYTNSEWFYEIDYNLGYRYSKSSNKSWNEGILNDKLTETRHYYSLYLPVKYGKGRIEQVQDARLAVYLFDELSKSGIITKEIGKENILELAEVISRLKNKRFLDSRIKRIEDIEALDSFLQSGNYIKNTGSHYFTTLFDLWEYGASPVRNSGERYAVALYPGFSHSSIKNSDLFSTVDIADKIRNNFYISGGFEYTKEKPVNLYWQNTIQAGAYFGIIEEIHDHYSNSDANKIRVPSLQLSFSQNFNYYPNTRTTAGCSYNLKYVKLFDKSNSEKNIFGMRSKGLSAYANLFIDYYISPRFRLNASANIYFDWQESKLGNNISTDYLWFDSFTQNVYELGGYYDYTEFRSNFRIKLLYSIF